MRAVAEIDNWFKFIDVDEVIMESRTVRLSIEAPLSYMFAPARRPPPKDFCIQADFTYRGERQGDYPLFRFSHE